MNKILILIIMSFAIFMYGCNEDNGNKIPPAGSVRGKTLDIDPYGSKTDLKESKAPTRNSTAGTVKGKTMEIEPYK